MTTTVYSKFDKNASRLELFIRIFYLIAVQIVVMLYGMLIGIWAMAIFVLQVLHWFYILFFGKRWESVNKYTTEFINFAYGRFYFDYIYTKVVPYMFLLTDKRPGFTI